MPLVREQALGYDPVFCWGLYGTLSRGDRVQIHVEPERPRTGGVGVSGSIGGKT